jgi:hypothetical protein
MKRKSSLSGTKNQILQQISELFLEEFWEKKTLRSLDGIIQREIKKQKENTQKSSD